MTTITLSGGEGLERILESIARKIARPATLRVGFLEGAVYPGTTTSVAMVAAINNFGAPEKGIPARPFFTKMVEEKSGAWGNALVGRLKAAEWDVTAALNAMGQGIANQLEQSIDEMNDPPNSMVTNLLKQRFPFRDGMEFSDVVKAWGDVANGETAKAGKPLIWSGYMRNSINWEVTT